MDKPLRILLIVVLSLAVINVFSMFFQSSQLKQIQRNIETSQKNINSAINNLNAARAKIDSIRTDIENFKSYIKNIQTNVELLNTKKELEEAKASARLSSQVKGLRQRVAELERDLDQVDSLPDIEIQP